MHPGRAIRSVWQVAILLAGILFFTSACGGVARWFCIQGAATRLGIEGVANSKGYVGTEAFGVPLDRTFGKHLLTFISMAEMMVSKPFPIAHAWSWHST